MKVGDLVKWIHPLCKDTGIILKLNASNDGEAIVHWFGNPEHSGLYPPNHHLLEPLDESG